MHPATMHLRSSRYIPSGEDAPLSDQEMIDNQLLSESIAYLKPKKPSPSFASASDSAPATMKDDCKYCISRWDEMS